MGYDLRASFGSAVGVFSSQVVAFTVSPYPFVVAVALIAGDTDNSPDFGCLPYGFQYILGAHGITFKRKGGVFI